MSKKQIIMMTVSILLNIFGLSSLLYLNKVVDIGLLKFYDSIPYIILRYIFVIGSMGGGITLFTAFAASFKEKKPRNRLSIGVCIYASILTLPLVYTFVACFFVANGIMLFMADEIALEIMDIFSKPWLYYTAFTIGTIFAVIALVFPIFTTYLTVKELTPKEFFAKKKA